MWNIVQNHRFVFEAHSWRLCIHLYLCTFLLMYLCTFLHAYLCTFRHAYLCTYLLHTCTHTYMSIQRSSCVQYSVEPRTKVLQKGNQINDYPFTSLNYMFQMSLEAIILLFDIHFHRPWACFLGIPQHIKRCNVLWYTIPVEAIAMGYLITQK